MSIDEFIKEVKEYLVKNNEKFTLDIAGHIRILVEQKDLHKVGECCPVTYLQFRKNNKFMPTACFAECAKDLNMLYGEVNQIAWAADWSDGCGYPDLRKKLVEELT